MKTQSALERVWRYGPLILWISLISFESTSEFSAINTSRIVRPLLVWLFPNISEERIGIVHFLVRKAAHFTEYAVLGLLAARAFYSSSHQLLRRWWFVAGLFLIIIQALVDEYHQSFVPSRSASFLDSIIDIAGGFMALTGCAYVLRRAQVGRCARSVKP